MSQTTHLAASVFRSGQSSDRPLVTLRNATVRGRARFQIRGLARSPYLAARLRQRLAAAGAIEVRELSLVTGNALLGFPPEQPADDVRGMLEAFVRSEVLAAARQDPGELETALALAADGRAARRDWHLLSTADVAGALDTAPDTGLSDDAAMARARRFGANTLAPAAAPSAVARFAGQLANLPSALLAGSAVTAILAKNRLDAALILSVMASNAAIGYATEANAERVIGSLGLDEPPVVTVIRGGSRRDVHPAELVPGDLIALVPGPIPADVRLIGAEHLTVDESALTGESAPVRKTADACPAPRAPLGEQGNMLFRGTVVLAGAAVGIVVATGGDTETGAIQTLVGTVRPPATPLQTRLDVLGRNIAWLACAICGGVMATGLMRGLGLLPMLRTAVSLAVAAIPEGLPTVGTTTLALGIRQMKRRDVFIRRLVAVENLGAISDLCFDKTGTLTENRMAVTRVTLDGQSHELGPAAPPAGVAARQMALVAALCNEATHHGGDDPDGWTGSPTECALARMALRLAPGLLASAATFPRLSVRRRTDSTSYMATAHRTPEGGFLLAVKGSPEEVLALCTAQLVDGAVQPLGAGDGAAIAARNEALAGEGLRVLAFAYRDVAGMPERPGALFSAEDGAQGGLVWVGLAGLTDPPRAGMPALIAAFHTAGIRTCMITGDQESTALAISRQLGLSGARAPESVGGHQLAHADGDELAGLVEGRVVFSRINPQDKLRIVQALQRRGHVVAMTGDGINDSPALRAADVGIAMGAGAAVAREAAQVVLAQDGLEMLYEAVLQGRTIRDNLGKALRFLLATNLSEVLVTLGGVLGGDAEVLNPRHLLWINLLTDVFPALALALDPPDPDVMRRPPRAQNAPLFDRDEWRHIGLDAVVMAGGALLAHRLSARTHGPGRHASTMAFLALTTAQILDTASARSMHLSVFSRERLDRNKYVALAMGLGLGIQWLTVATPALRAMLKNDRLSARELATVGAVGALTFIGTETLKSVLGTSRSHSLHTEV